VLVNTNIQPHTSVSVHQGCKQHLSLRDRDIRFLVRDNTETLQGRDVFGDLQPSALCQNNEWRR